MDLVVRVPQGFLVTRVESRKAFCDKRRKGNSNFEQTAQDLNPFVVAAAIVRRVRSWQAVNRFLSWSRAEVNSQDLQRAGESFSKTLANMTHCSDRAGKSKSPFWIVECPPRQVAFCNVARFIPRFFMARNGTLAEMISRDTVAIDPGVPQGQREALGRPCSGGGLARYGQIPVLRTTTAHVRASFFAAALRGRFRRARKFARKLFSARLAQIPTGASREIEWRSLRFAGQKPASLLRLARSRGAREVSEGHAAHALCAPVSRF